MTSESDDAVTKAFGDIADEAHSPKKLQPDARKLFYCEQVQSVTESYKLFTSNEKEVSNGFQFVPLHRSASFPSAASSSRVLADGKPPLRSWNVLSCP